METAIGDDSPRVRFMPPRVFWLCLLVGGFLFWLFPWRINWFTPTWRIALGAGLALAGFSFMMWGHGIFRDRDVNVPTNLPARELVMQGAYRFSRNPMYVGFLAILLGIGLAVGSWWMLLNSLPMALYLAFYVVPREEAYLTRAFGDDFLNYRLEVRRWL